MIKARYLSAYVVKNNSFFFNKLILNLFKYTYIHIYFDYRLFYNMKFHVFDKGFENFENTEKIGQKLKRIFKI